MFTQHQDYDDDDDDDESPLDAQQSHPLDPTSGVEGFVLSFSIC